MKADSQQSSSEDYRIYPASPEQKRKQKIADKEWSQ
jgi:hypothetical protein